MQLAKKLLYSENNFLNTLQQVHEKLFSVYKLSFHWDNITKNVHSIIYWPFGLYGRYEGLKTCKQVLNWISVQEITIPNIKMYIGWY